ncbi:MAG: OmpA family protein [Flavobacteriales bacterium]|nr:OmpA family protein [Flavobacteriales bacterium]
MRLFYIILFSLFFYLNCFSQGNVAFEKSNFKSNPTGLKAAIISIKEGDFKYNTHLYNEALEKYLSANQFNPSNAELNAKIGDCYLHTSEKSKAIDYFKKAYELDKNIDGYYIYSYAKSYHINEEFDEAIKLYRTAKSKGSNFDRDLSANCDHKIKECTFAKKLVTTPVNVKIENLNTAINTENEEYVPVITADESEIYFTSRRKGNTGGNMDMALGDYYEDIYYSKKENGEWSEAENIGSPVNSEFHDATVGLSLDGQKLFIYRDNKKGIGNILMAEKKGKKWKDPEELPEPINSKNQETSACFSPDGNTIYFVSNRPDGIGGKDIYKSTKNKDGKWGEAENLGRTINTIDDEDAVFLHADGKTLYFSSKGHKTMGGYDIFKSTYEKGKWSTPENIGYPINTADDDVCFVLTASGEYGYYTSAKLDGKGKRDIYRVSFIDELNKPKLTLLKGVITDKKTGEPLVASIEIYDNNEDKQVGTFESNSASGKYMISLPAGRDYGISVKAQGYLFYSDNFNIPDTAAFQVIEKNVALEKLEKGKKVVLKNIFYDYNKASLRPSSFNELNKVIELLDHNPNMKIEISAHTDSRGSDAYNDKLSQARAQSCVDYLVQKNIPTSRLIAKGYGEKQLMITDDLIEKLATEAEKEEAHQQNRRTEFKIIEY